jgi:hypothetical protein
MIIYQREPVFTIGQAPFLAGAIHVRNEIRVLKQREKARNRKALVKRNPLLRAILPRNFSRRRAILQQGVAALLDKAAWTGTSGAGMTRTPR